MTQVYNVKHANGMTFPVFYYENRGYVWLNLLTRKPTAYCIPRALLNAERCLRTMLDLSGHKGAELVKFESSNGEI